MTCSTLKREKVPKIISLYELYQVQIELSITIGVTIMFLFILMASNFKMPPDLLLLPWIIWIGKKLIDNIQMFKKTMFDIEHKFKIRARQIRREQRQQREATEQLFSSNVADILS